AAIGTSGGRVVSLTDGREYVITGASLVFGREAGCDVVVVGKDVSRRHAEIVHTPRGYLVVDSSTNGTFVNEEQVQGQRILARTDVIRIGEEQFRFYAEAPPLTASAAPAPAPAASPEQLKHTFHGLDAVAPPPPPPPGPVAPPAPPARPARPAAPRPSAAPARPGAAAPLGAARPGMKPAPRRPAGQQPPPKKGKGCGSGAAVLVIGGAAVVVVLY